MYIIRYLKPCNFCLKYFCLSFLVFEIFGWHGWSDTPCIYRRATAYTHIYTHMHDKTSSDICLCGERAPDNRAWYVYVRHTGDFFVTRFARSSRFIRLDSLDRGSIPPSPSFSAGGAKRASIEGERSPLTFRRRARCRRLRFDISSCV